MADKDAEIRKLVRAGRKIEAIRQYREQYAVSLVEAKEAVEAIAEGREPTPRAAAAALPSDEEAIALPTPEFAAILDDLVKSGQKIQAIKLYRARYGFGLKDAKDYIDEWERRGSLPLEPPSGSPTPVTAGTGEFGTAIDALAQRDDAIRMQPDEEFAAALDANLRSGNKIEAMRLYRLRYSVGLKKAKAAIEAWERGVRVLPAAQAIPPEQSTRQAVEKRPPAAPRPTESSTAEPCEGHIDGRNLGQGIDLALQMGRHEEAIQLYQERAGVSRQEAERTIAARERQISGGQVARSGCFIATAAFESEDAPEVRLLRRFRDDTLSRTKSGRNFIRWYYHWSPPAAEWLASKPTLRPLVRALFCSLIRLCPPNKQ